MRAYRAKEAVRARWPTRAPSSATGGKGPRSAGATPTGHRATQGRNPNVTAACVKRLHRMQSARPGPSRRGVSRRVFGRGPPAHVQKECARASLSLAADSARPNLRPTSHICGTGQGWAQRLLCANRRPHRPQPEPPCRSWGSCGATAKHVSTDQSAASAPPVRG